MRPGVRKLVLTTHITSSVGSLGAVAAFLVLAVVGLKSADAMTAASVYVAMRLTTWYVVLPFLVLSLASGVLQSLGTPWGLFRHYWIVVKLGLTLLALVVLMVQMPVIDHMAAAAQSTLAAGELGLLRKSLVLHAAGGLVVLLIATTLSVYKPRALTPYGARKELSDLPTPRWVKGFGVAGTLLLVLFVLMFVGGKAGHHGPGRHLMSTHAQR
jgi:hypothetical protein